jgi:hypothetical protein
VLAKSVCGFGAQHALNIRMRAFFNGSDESI